MSRGEEDLLSSPFHLMVVLSDVRPEVVTNMQRSVKVSAPTFD